MRGGGRGSAVVEPPANVYNGGVAAKPKHSPDLTTYVDREPTALWTLGVLAAAGLTVAARFHWSTWTVLALSLATVLFAGGVLWAITLYPRTYLGQRWTSLGFLVALFLLCDSIGQAAFQIQWRRSFQVNGPWKEFTDRGQGWRVAFPLRWVPYELYTPTTGTVIFKPARMTPAIEFSVTRHPRPAAPDLTSVVESYYLNLQKSTETKILAGEAFRYAGGHEAYRMVHQDPKQALVLRQENIFLLHGEELYILTATAVPAWFKRFQKDLDRFLHSLRLTA